MPSAISLLTVVLLSICSPLVAAGQTMSGVPGPTPSPSSYDSPPRLVVVISIDQFRYDYLERFGPWLSENGFNRFIKRGADFDNAFHNHSTTFTGPGHAVIGTGRPPSETGIVGNIWIDRGAAFDQNAWDWFFNDTPGFDAATHPPADPEAGPWYAHGGVPRYCVYDDRVSVSEGKTSGMSPVSLGEDSLGDRVKERFPGSRVMAAGLKDRAAILMGGRRADAVYWFDPGLPGFISSSYYRYDRSILDFNTRVKSYIPESGLWKLSGIIPAADLKRVTFDPPAVWPLKNQKYGGTFDHPVRDGWSLAYSPFANDMLLDFASSIIEGQKLGSGTTPDLFYLAISTPDYVGHYFGPDSMEVADDVVRLDRSLERFVATLEQKFGDRLLVAVTSDHGVQSSPEVARLRDPKIDAGKLDLRNPVRTAHFISELPPARIEIERKVAKNLGLPFRLEAPLADAFIFFFEEPSLYLNWDRIAALKLDGERVKRVVRDVVLSMKDFGIDRVFINSELLTPRPGATDVERAVRRSFRADRSGDILMTLRKNWIWTYRITTHGQPLADDQHVPLLLWGAAIKPGRYKERVSPLDLAGTIGAIFGIGAGSSEAHTLPCLMTSAEKSRATITGATPDTSAAIRAILAAALEKLDPGKRTFLAGRTIDSPTRQVLESLRKVAPATADNELLPAGFARLDRVRIEGDKAYVTIWTGPIPKPMPNVMTMSCGTGYTVQFHKSAQGNWVMEDGMGVVMC